MRSSYLGLPQPLLKHKQWGALRATQARDIPFSQPRQILLPMGSFPTGQKLTLGASLEADGELFRPRARERVAVIGRIPEWKAPLLLGRKSA